MAGIHLHVVSCALRSDEGCETSHARESESETAMRGAPKASDPEKHVF